MLSAHSMNEQPNYSINDFLFRFKKLQSLLVESKLDAFLVICGFDSRDNIEYFKLVAWLFKGITGIGLEEVIALDDKYRDFVMLVKKEGASFYIEPKLFTDLKKYILAIPNVEIYSPTEKETENQEELELVKIAHFYQMTKTVGPVGVLLGKKDNKKINNIEKWPLLQAYALEGTLIFL